MTAVFSQSKREEILNEITNLKQNVSYQKEVNSFDVTSENMNVLFSISQRVEKNK